jgi:4'-phosphopantetheinyl transferase
MPSHPASAGAEATVLAGTRNGSSAEVALWFYDLDSWDAHGATSSASPASAGALRCQSGQSGATPGPRTLAERRRKARREGASLAARTFFGNRGGYDESEIIRYCPACGQGDHGRPTLTGTCGDTGISISSSGRASVVALAGGPVGVDIELAAAELASPVPEVPSQVLTAREAAALARLGPDKSWASFLRIWTAKEAVAKADGRGLLAPLDQLDASALMDRPFAWVSLEGAQWHVQVFPLPGSVPGALSLATPAPATVSWHGLP